jgi:hypothetical protein
MDTITDRLSFLDNKIHDEGNMNLVIHNEGEWGNTQNEYNAFNDAGVECETGEFLYALTRLLKPQNILETGTHWGIGASYMGLACKDNGKGHVDTYEFLPEIHKVASRRIERLEIVGQVTCHLGDVGQLIPDKQYQLMFLDTEPQTRFSELVRFFDYLDEGGFVFIHDLHRHMHQIPNEDHGFAWPYGKIPFPMQQWVQGGQLRPFHFSTPRGLTGFYKVSKDDYKWGQI